MYEQQNSSLLNSHRDDLINIIVEEVTVNKIQLKTNDFDLILSEICVNFPCENVMQVRYSKANIRFAINKYRYLILFLFNF